LSSCAGELFEVSLDAGACPMHVALGRPDGNARHARDLRVGEPEGIAQDDRCPLLRREARERLRQIAPQIGQRGEAPRIRFLVRSRLLDGVRLCSAEALERHTIPACVHDEAVKPCRELGLAPELPQSRAELDERFLGGVASILEIVEQLRCQPVDLGRIPLHEDVERL
jgi:hypothetical protein